MNTALQDRIRGKITVAENGCWIWIGATRGIGYGAIKVEGKVIDAHRASYEAFNGPIPAGKLVMHNCDVRGCVNPDHLSVGNHSENSRDAGAKGRCPGKSVGRVLTDQEIAKILDQYDSGQSKRQIQKAFSIPPTTLTRLLMRHGREEKKAWAET